MLEKIVSYKRLELSARMLELPMDELVHQISEEIRPSFRSAITKEGINIIAEIKYRSPSHGSFTCQLPALELARIYSENGASAISVLTEKRYFSGDLHFLQEISEDLDEMPLLRKDFILDRYQVLESRVNGASACLFIVACLEENQLRELIACSADWALDAVVEIHSPRELEKAINSGASIIGVNNRDLRTFTVDLSTSFEIAKRMERETGYVLVSESGIQEHSQLLELQDAGFSAFLVGSILMDLPNPGKKLRELIGNR